MSTSRRMTPEVRRGVNKWLVQAGVGMVGYGAVIFLPAGTLSWVWGWALLIILAAMLIAHPLILLPVNPELLAERGKGTRAAGVKTWDKAITASAGTMMILSWMVGGLDFRFGWTPSPALWVHLAGALVMSLGYALFMWAMAANAFFSEGVRIQHERGHTVAVGGPYHFVRHPGYVGAIVAQSATPFLLGSIWAGIPILFLVVLFVLRTFLEDKALRAELPGYEEYARRTRYRLLPGVW